MCIVKRWSNPKVDGIARKRDLLGQVKADNEKTCPKSGLIAYPPLGACFLSSKLTEAQAFNARIAAPFRRQRSQISRKSSKCTDHHLTLSLNCEFSLLIIIITSLSLSSLSSPHLLHSQNSFNLLPKIRRRPLPTRLHRQHHHQLEYVH